MSKHNLGNYISMCSDCMVLNLQCFHKECEEHILIIEKIDFYYDSANVWRTKCEIAIYFEWVSVSMKTLDKYAYDNSF